MSKQLLLVEDDSDMGELIQESLKPLGWDVCLQASAEGALALLHERAFDAIATDLNLEGMSGIELCEHVADIWPETPVLVLTAFGSMDSAISALRAHACDFMHKPLEMSALAHSLERALQHNALRKENRQLRDAAGEQVDDELVGQSPVMLEVSDLIRRVGDTAASVLLTGESGTGKELIARALHRQSSRRERPFVAVNCAALPGSLLESELFGHARGAFTDARQARKGLFEQADGGTLLLDEVGEMAPEMQAKLLRVLQERTVRPIGSSTEVPFDTRIIAATNKDMEAEVAAQRFREDLFYRLNVVQILVPPLRHRDGDVLLLAEYFLRRAAERLGKQVTGMSRDVAQRLLAYDWPGNVRELENWMERAVAMACFERITLEDLPVASTFAEPSPALTRELDAEHVLSWEEVERRHIEQVLNLVKGNKVRAARMLGLDRRTLYRKLERYLETGS